MKNILLPTDFSVNSMNAIDYAMQFFERRECHFFILNVQKISEYISDDLVTGTPSGSIYNSIATDNKKLINQLVKRLSKQYKSQEYTFQGLFDYDDFVSAVRQAVSFHAIDLIIMGTNGATSAKEILFGSNTLQVIRNVDCPTLTIPAQYSYSNIKNVLFSIQNCENISLDDLQTFKAILHMHPCELYLLELGNDDTAKVSLQKDNDCIKKLFPNNPYHYFYLNTLPGLIAVNTATQLLKVDLHAVFVKRELFLERVLFGSETSQLTYNTIIPLLFLHRE